MLISTHRIGVCTQVLLEIHKFVRDEFIYTEAANMGSRAVATFSSDCVAKLMDKGSMWPTKVLGPPLFSIGDGEFRRQVTAFLKVNDKKHAVRKLRSDFTSYKDEHTQLFHQLSDGVSILAYFSKQCAVVNKAKVASLQRTVSTLTEVNEKVAALKTRRELEYAHHREQMAALREKGTSKMTEDAAAEARTEDQRAAVWADMSERERSFARQQVVDSKAAASQAAANKAPAGQLKRLREEAERRKNVIPRLAHADSLAVTRGQVVSASGRGK